jgi:hypothetical protein
MIRLFLGATGLVLCLRLIIKSDDALSQGLALLFVPIFVFYTHKAIEKIKEEDSK